MWTHSLDISELFYISDGHEQMITNIIPVRVNGRDLKRLIVCIVLYFASVIDSISLDTSFNFVDTFIKAAPNEPFSVCNCCILYVCVSVPAFKDSQ